MPDPIPSPALLNADRYLNSVVKAYDVNQSLQSLQQTFQRGQLIDLQAGQAMIQQVREGAKGIWGPQGDYARKLVDRFETEWLTPAPGPTRFSNTLNTALNSFTGQFVGNVLVTNQQDQYNDFLRALAPKESTKPPPKWDEIKDKLNIQTPLAATSNAVLDFNQLLKNFEGTPQDDINAVTAPQPYEGLLKLFPSPPATELVPAFEGLNAVLALKAQSPKEVIGIARSQLGVNYVWGGETPAGFDCSGLVQWVFGKVGVQVPRTTWEQFRSKRGENVGWGQLRPADVVYFTVPGSTGPNHTGIYMGDGKMIVAPRAGLKVQIQPLKGYWQQHFHGAKRFI